MGLGERLRTIRKNRGLTLTQLSRYSKVSKAYLSQLENEQFSNPSSEVVIKLCSTLGVSVDGMLGLETMPVTILSCSEVPLHLRALAHEEHLNDDDITMLSNISYKGRQPTSMDGWRTVLKAIRQSTEDTKPISQNNSNEQ